MAWIPRYKSSGLCSPLIPNGDLSGLIRLCGQYGNLFDVPNGISGNYGSSQDDPGGLHSWDGAFGFNLYNALIGKLKSEARGGGASHSNITIAEVEVKKPRGAQYYKQTIAVVGDYSVGAEQTSHGYHGDDAFVLKWAGGNFSVIKVVRREYSTPYSQYTSTDLFVQTLGQNFAIVTQGYNDYWIENRESFLTKMYFSMSFATHNNVKYFCWAIYSELQNQASYDDPKKKGCAGLISGLTETHLDTVYGDFEPDEQEDPNEDPEEPPGPGDKPDEPGGGGGEGDHILPDEPVPIPDKPYIGPGSVSWLTLYCMDLDDINEFGEELVNPTPMQMLKQYFTDPLDAIVSICMVPMLPQGVRYQKTPVIHGNPDYEWSRSFTVCSQYAQLDCGEVEIPPYWDNSFDFDPYTKFSIWLPYIGFKDISADDVMGARIRVKYTIDCVTGDCTAFVARYATEEDFYGACYEQIIGIYSGNCGVQVPIGRVSHDKAIEMTFKMIAAGAGAVAGGLAGMAGITDGTNLTSQQISNQVSNSAMAGVEGNKRDIQRSGAIAGNTGYMGYQKPFIIRTIPRQSLPDNYKELMGYPCNKGGTLNDFTGSGLAMVEEIQLNNIPAMEDERAEIMSWLRKGVLI